MERVRIALVGVGGFGRTHENAALRLVEEGLVEIVAFAEPNDRSVAESLLPSRHVRHYRDYSEMLAAERTLDLVCIATPIPFHYAMAQTAFERGLHVFLEKPPVVCIQLLRELMRAQEKAGRFCAVGFHDMARPSVVTLKRLLCEGAVGKVQSIRAEARWLRTDAYYTRSGWAGRLRLGDQWILDGPMMNSCAHVLNMACYLASPEIHEFSRPRWVQAELYRAADIEGEDTNCLRAEMDSGVEVCVHLTHCVETPCPRAWAIQGTEGAAELRDDRGVTVPGVKVPPDAQACPTETLLRRLVEVVQGSDEPLLMPLAEAEAWLLLVNGAYESGRRIVSIPPEFTTRQQVGESYATVVNNLSDVISVATKEGKLLSECGLPWAQRSDPFFLENYSKFPVRWGM